MAPRLPEKIYFKIGEVSEIVGVEPYVFALLGDRIRFAQAVQSSLEASALQKARRRVVTRYQALLYTEGFTIEGARKKLKETKKEEKDQLKLPLSEQKYKSALVKIRKDLESLRKLLS